MTEKRYTVGEELKVVDDNILKGTFYFCIDRVEALKLADKLNEFHNENVRLNKENEQLKQRNKKMLKVMFALKNYVENEDYERINNAVEKIKEEILND